LMDKQVYASGVDAVQLQVSDLSPGLYVVRIIGEEQSFMAKFIRE